MLRGLPGNSLVFVQFEQSGGVFKIAALALEAVSLDFAEFVQAFLELAGETLALEAGGGGGAGGAAVRPWRSAFNAERRLPESVRGPVERRELARLMAVRDAIGVADMGFLATGIACARGAGGRGVRGVLIGKRGARREAGDCRGTGAKK